MMSFCFVVLMTFLFVVPLVPAIDSGLTPHFRKWLTDNGFNAGVLARDELAGGSFGGRRTDGEEVRKEPVIFVHGNPDRATGGKYGGWANAAAYFESKGYSSAELYATTWDPADSSKAMEQTHSFAYVSHIRNFIQAVLLYTGANRVDIVSHSMGVTLSRRAIKGGKFEDKDLGSALTNRVDTFVGLAGVNYGLITCLRAPLISACNILDGFYPGSFNPLIQSVVGRSQFLNDMLTGQTGFEGAYRYAVWSVDDETLTQGCIVYGTVTCRFPGMTGDKKLTGIKHMEVKDSFDVYYQMLTDHIVP